MGNRAVIAFGPNAPDTVGIYVHWNGGPESILAFMEAAKQLKVRDPLDDNYGVARIAQIIANYFGGTTSIGLGKLSELDTDNGDNGVYIVHEGFVVTWKNGSKPLLLDNLSDGERTAYGANLAKIMEVNAPIFAKG